jgi:ankyrin repeat protein
MARELASDIESSPAVVTLETETPPARLLAACEAGDAARAAALIADGAADFGARVSAARGATALHCACEAGMLCIARALMVEKGFDVAARTRSGASVVMAACQGELDECALWALENGADARAVDAVDGTDALYWACYKAMPRVALALLARGASAVVASSPDQFTALHWASGKGLTEVLRRLVAAGADVNARSSADTGHDTPLAFAHRAQRAEAAALLRTLGAEPDDADAIDLSARARRGETARAARLLQNELLRSVARGDVESVRRAIQRGASPDARELSNDPSGSRTPIGTTALIYACALGHADIAEAILDAGANVELCDARGYNAVHCSAEEGRVALILLLLRVVGAGAAEFRIKQIRPGLGRTWCEDPTGGNSVTLGPERYYLDL